MTLQNKIKEINKRFDKFFWDTENEDDCYLELKENQELRDDIKHFYSQEIEVLMKEIKK